MDDFISDLTLRQFGTVSIFRRYQNEFLAAAGAGIEGTVVELGSDEAIDNSRFFPKASGFRRTNIKRGSADLLDITALDLPDASQDAFLCSSVLAHVDDLTSACAEMARTLRPGGALVATTPFMHPGCDRYDYWRIGPDGWSALLGPAFEIEALVHLGGKITSLAALLQRPVGSWKRQYVPQKLLGLAVIAVLGRFDQPDRSPLGWGLLARRTEVPWVPLSERPRTDVW